MTIHLSIPQTSTRYEVHTREGCYYTDVEEQARRWGQRNHQTYIMAITETRQKLPVGKLTKAAPTKSAAIKAAAKRLNIPVNVTPLLVADPTSAAGFPKPARAAASSPKRSSRAPRRSQGLAAAAQHSPSATSHEAPVLATATPSKRRVGR